MTTTEERDSPLSGAFQQFSVLLSNMVTREEVRAAIAAAENRLRSDIQAGELRIIRWNVGTIIAAAAVAIAAVKLLP